MIWYEYAGGFIRRFLHADHQGSIVAATDAAGNAAAIAAYDAWGIPNSGSVGVHPTGVGRFGYTGQAWIPELGMYHYKARVYSPTLGRFLQTDPVGYEDQFNLYAYVRNDPMNHVDPRGTDAIILRRENGDIGVVLPMTFTGDAATPENIAAVISNIESRWSGTVDGINITTSVVQGTSPLDPSARNTMEITAGNTSRNHGHSWVAPNPVPGTGMMGQLTMKDVSKTPIVGADGQLRTAVHGADTPAHEGGHYMGVLDRPGASLMGSDGGTNIIRRDLNEINVAHTPSGSFNTIIHCSEDDRC